MIRRLVLSTVLFCGMVAALPAAHAVADPSPGLIRVTEVVGDARTADRITVLVPGAGVTPGNFQAGLGNVTRRAPAKWAHWLADEARDGRVAVIAWLGYLPPKGASLAVARGERADVGARELEGYVAELAVANPRATITLVGHSYGSVVVGHAAAALPASVTDLVFVGSPGTGAHTVRDLGTRARVWAGRSADDWISRIPNATILGYGHDTDPTAPDFGARALPVDGVSGHDGYFVPGTGSLRALASISTTGTLPDPTGGAGLG
ncbi:alpha/beta hydrolase [Longispora sp. K20-0274]|uniref:alpha/beta hydrolase n=1 Tax=Longispora sp. K20-0274 TaxID=3088255 RepID=UPI00399B1D3A